MGFLKSLGMNDDSVDGQLIRAMYCSFLYFSIGGLL